MHERFLSKFYYKKVKENGSVIIQPALEYGHQLQKKKSLNSIFPGHAPHHSY